ncbi:hypothetical protein RFI_22484 [Reticulomyxa filosa]|uniref:BACK domain-containing protein n=1 Tax=Reticulomyxa filosa TaxID=46433 RepID=X6MMN9_RETFI|nr:hypothetical protein RFI_22484 [Reticulomyxa filosa]|eukprot:ETO14881.1 hypothetical protein RFI_22484 [Reticulomyxa filosa]
MNVCFFAKWLFYLFQKRLIYVFAIVSKLQKIESQDDMKAVTVENAEIYLLYASKYAQLLTKKNFAHNVWTHVIVTNYLTSLDSLFRLVQSFQTTHQNDVCMQSLYSSVFMGAKILQRELFSNRSRMQQLISSSTSSFYALSETSMKLILSSNELDISEEQLFDGVMEWSKRTVDREKAHARDNHKNTNEAKSSFESWKEHIRGVLPLIRFPIMDSDYILKNVLPNRDMFADSQHLLFILSFHLGHADATYLKDLPYSAQPRNANVTPTNKNQTREEKLQSENKSLRKTISELTTKVNQLEIQARRSARPSQSNMFGVDSANTNVRTSNIKVNNGKTPSNTAVVSNKLTTKPENESGKRNSNPPASLSPLPQAGTHRKDNETSATTIEHSLEDAEHLTSSSEDGEDEDKKKRKSLQKAVSSDSTQKERSHRKEKQELEEEDENEEQHPSEKDELDEEDNLSQGEQQKQQEGEKKPPQHWGQLSVAADSVDSMVEGNQGAQFVVGFRKLNNFDEEENEKAKYGSKTKEVEEQTGGLLC